MKTWELAKYVQVWVLWRLIVAIEWRHCECCTSWPWLVYSQSRNFWKYATFIYLQNDVIERKMLKYVFFRGWYWPSNGAIASVVHPDLVLFFKVIQFQEIKSIHISGKRWELATNLGYNFYFGWYLSSNGSIANVALQYLDNIFRTNFSSGYFRKLPLKIAGIYHWIAPQRMF